MLTAKACKKSPAAEVTRQEISLQEVACAKQIYKQIWAGCRVGQLHTEQRWSTMLNPNRVPEAPTGTYSAPRHSLRRGEGERGFWGGSASRNNQ